MGKPVHVEVDGRTGREVFAFSEAPALPLRASGGMLHNDWKDPLHWACDADGQWWMNDSFSRICEPCGREDVMGSASSAVTGYGDTIRSVPVNDIEGMAAAKNEVLLRAQQAWAEAARLYERAAALEDGIVAKLKERGEDWTGNAAGAESCRRLAGKLNGES